MKRAPFLLGFIFISVTIRRVAHFAGGDVLAWTFSVAIALSVFLSAYMASSYKGVRRAGWAAMFFFILIDGLFNLAEVIAWSVETGRWARAVEFGLGPGFPLHRYADIVYGLSPTMAVLLLGWLARRVEAAFEQAERSRKRSGSFRQRAGRALGDWLFGEEVSGSEPETPEETPEKSGALPEWMETMPKNRKEFLAAVQAGRIVLPAGLSGAEAARHLPVGERSARAWLAAARNGDNR